MDKARRREERLQRSKAEAAFEEVHTSVANAVACYHKEWGDCFHSFKIAKQQLRAATEHFSRAGMVAEKLTPMTGGGMRTHAREVTELDKLEDLAFLHEPKLNPIVVLDFLDRSAALNELQLRIDAEMAKAKLRQDGDQWVTYANRAIDQGGKDQASGLFASANKCFASARTAIADARASYAKISEVPDEILARWEAAKKDAEGNPMMTQENLQELEEALKAREVWDQFTIVRDWKPSFGFGHPVFYSLNRLKVGQTYDNMCKGLKFAHCPEGLKPDGSDTKLIVEELEKNLEEALLAQKRDMEFKSLAVCSLDELREAQQRLLDAARSDVVNGEEAADVAIAKAEEPLPLLVAEWHDLPSDKLGGIAMTDEARELHDCAISGNLERVMWLLDECTKQHYRVVDARHKVVKTFKEELIHFDDLDYDGQSALFKCSKYNQEPIGRLLIERGAKVNRVDVNGATPLHMAAGSGATEMVKLLLEHQADPAARNTFGESPLHYCGRFSLGDIDIARSFIASGVDLNILDNSHQTVLHHVVKNRRFGTKELFMLNLFCLFGADADARNGDGKTPLDLCDYAEARAILRTSYQDQTNLRIQRWGPTGLPPTGEEVPLSLHEQAMEITMGIPLLCVLHKGRKAYVNREACRACGIGIVVTVPFQGTTDFAHMCANCGVKEVSNTHIRGGGFV